MPMVSSAIELTALHVWPRGHCLIVSHPNRDGSHTLTLFLPFEGEDSFATTNSAGDVTRLFRKYFPDLLPLLPGLIEEWMAHATGTLITTRTAPWVFGRLGGAGRRRLPCGVSVLWPGHELRVRGLLRADVAARRAAARSAASLQELRAGASHAYRCAGGAFEAELSRAAGSRPVAVVRGAQAPRRRAQSAVAETLAAPLHDDLAHHHSLRGRVGARATAGSHRRRSARWPRSR